MIQSKKIAVDFVEDFCAPGKSIRQKPTIQELRKLVKEKYESRASTTK